MKMLFRSKNLVILTVTLVVIFFTPLAYYFAFALPAQQAAELDFEKQKYEQEQSTLQDESDKEVEKSEMLQSCLVSAHQAYADEGTAVCKELGYNDEEIKNLKCMLTGDALARMEEKQQDAQDFCFQLYK